MPLSAWNLLYMKALLDLESTNALLANVLVLAPLQTELLKVSVEGQLEVRKLKPLCRLLKLQELKAVLNQSGESLPDFQISNLGNYRSA